MFTHWFEQDAFHYRVVVNDDHSCPQPTVLPTRLNVTNDTNEICPRRVLNVTTKQPNDRNHLHVLHESLRRGKRNKRVVAIQPTGILNKVGVQKSFFGSNVVPQTGKLCRDTQSKNESVVRSSKIPAHENSWCFLFWRKAINDNRQFTVWNLKRNQ